MRRNRERVQVGCVIKSADLLAPALQGGFDYDLNPLASLIRDWSSENLLAGHSLATFLITENLNDLHPLVVNNPGAARIKIALPSSDNLVQAFEFFNPSYPCALREYSGQLPNIAQQLTDSTLGAIETLLKTREHSRHCLKADDLVKLKKELVEKDCNGLIEFIESGRTLDDIHGQEKRRGGSAQGLSDLRPRRHRQDIYGRVPGRRSPCSGHKAQEFSRQVGGQHTG